MTEPISIETYLRQRCVAFDARSPAEFAHAHIPGATSLPLFTNEERAVIGTLYKKDGQEAAIQHGLKLVGPKLADFVTQAKMHAPQGIATVHCWRGGMRSSAMTWLLNFAGIKTTQLIGGYKAFRRWVLEQFNLPYQFIVLGGLTGSGKTAILHALNALGEQVIDLEALAAHRGSSFGMLGMSTQPSTEQFENEIAFRLASFDKNRVIWIEDESRRIGACDLPQFLFLQMASAPLVVIKTSFEERLERLLAEYGSFPQDELIKASLRISKRLGGKRTQDISCAIKEGDLSSAVRELLHYYDTSYTRGINKRSEPLAIIDGTLLSITKRAESLQSLTAQRTSNEASRSI